MFKIVGIGVLALLLAACGALKGRHAAPQRPGAAPSLELPLPGRPYQIDENRSELRILVYRAGPLARLGHNHVMVNRRVHGAVNLAQEGASAFWLRVPVAEFIVDEPQARREEGTDFAAEVPDHARSGTLHNMLGATVLDAAEYPDISVDGIAAAGAPDSGAAPLVATLTIGVAGHESKIEVPFVLESDSGRLSASGSFELRQSALGLTPYSLMLGALQVQDAMTVKFRLVATAN
ncbi:MAG TPA: YceI family protein [Steroidobacteraceae bacterium]